MARFLYALPGEAEILRRQVGSFSRPSPQPVYEYQLKYDTLFLPATVPSTTVRGAVVLRISGRLLLQVTRTAAILVAPGRGSETLKCVAVLLLPEVSKQPQQRGEGQQLCEHITLQLLCPTQADSTGFEMSTSQLPSLVSDDGQLPLMSPYSANVTPVITPPTGQASCKVVSKSPFTQVSARCGCAGTIGAATVRAQ